MFKIESRDLTTPEARLLFDVRELLANINEKLTDNKQQTTEESIIVPDVPIVEQFSNKILTCRICGTKHINRGSFMACARKHKKEGATNVV